MGEKKIAEAYILGIPFGLFGAHHFYLKRKLFGIIYACTLGLFGIGYLFDLIRMRWLVRHTNRYGTDKKMVSDGYLICFLTGLFGGHHFYLGNKKLGIFYACTLGVFTVGWIVDLIRMRHLVKDHNDNREEKSLGTAYILGLSPFGLFGAYHYYLGNPKLGLIYTFTFGIFGIGWIVDLFRMPKLVRKAGHDTKSVGTAYIMSFPPFGLFGAYHYYLGNYALGLTYTFTLGIFGIGWIVDLFRMKGLVKAANDPTSDHGMTKITAYVLCVSPLGLFGAHHFYLERRLNGGFYVVTLGLFGFGWIFDMLRLPVLYERYAGEDKHKYPDEAYVYWLPFGLFGMHHFYLGNKKWGILYACTLGCLGIGWIIDGIRLPSMLKDYNNKLTDPDMVEFRICRPSFKSCSVYKCRRCCIQSFSFCCSCCEHFSLGSSSPANDVNANTQNKNRDDFDVINSEMNADGTNSGNEMNNMAVSNATYNDDNQYNDDGNISTVADSYNTYPTKDQIPNPTAPAYDNGAYPGDPGYEENTQYPGHDADVNIEYPPPYEGEQYAQSADDNQYQENYAHESDANYGSNDTVRNPDDVSVTVGDEGNMYDHNTHHNEEHGNVDDGQGQNYDGHHENSHNVHM